MHTFLRLFPKLIYKNTSSMDFLQKGGSMEFLKEGLGGYEIFKSFGMIVGLCRPMN